METDRPNVPFGTGGPTVDFFKIPAPFITTCTALPAFFKILLLGKEEYPTEGRGRWLIIYSSKFAIRSFKPGKEGNGAL
ncbi:MAG: hypothetical protein KAX05_02420, partial [Bacteroidales bacterium]|nr:hypothetical protein [Bacteroidales bacterium]